MIRLESRTATAVKTIARLVGGALALLAAALWAPGAHAYQWYDDGSGQGCVSCHDGFVNAGPLHFQHNNKFAPVTCNVCHQNGGGSKPVLTYWSGSGGGYGCAGCHGQAYGETSPNSGQLKATAYGLRKFHVDVVGEPSCGTSGCHQPGALGHLDPFPTLFGEDVAPPYFQPMFSNLTDPCSSQQEDLPFDLDSVGLDNDGDGAADYPADADCPVPATPTPTPTPAVVCGAAPAGGCIASGKGSLLVDEKKAGKEKLKVTLGKLQTAVTQGQFGDPVNVNGTAYAVCLYDAANILRGEYSLVQAGALCGDKPCWKAVSDKGYMYKDKDATADGIAQAKLKGGDAGKGQVKIQGKNSSGNLPTGVVAGLLQNPYGATVQVLSSNALCFSIGLTDIKADGTAFKGLGP